MTGRSLVSAYHNDAAHNDEIIMFNLFPSGPLKYIDKPQQLVVCFHKKMNNIWKSYAEIQYCYCVSFLVYRLMLFKEIHTK